MTRAERPDHEPMMSELLARWSERLGWRVSLEHPSVPEAARELAEALLGSATDAWVAVGRFAHTMGANGWALADVANWVTALADAAGPIGGPLRCFEAGVAVGEGWSASVGDEQRGDGCTDALTGLATRAFLGLRLQQVHDQCRALDLDARHVFALVVVDVDTSSRPPLYRDAARAVVAERVSRSFHTGETVCETGGPIVVLASRTPALARQVNELEEELRGLSILDQSGVLIWLEDLPADPALIEGFLLDLAGR